MFAFAPFQHFSSGAPLYVTCCTGQSQGGGAFVDGTADFLNCIIWSNKAGFGFGDPTQGGGVLVNTMGEAYFNGCEVKNNTAFSVLLTF